MRDNKQKFLSLVNYLAKKDSTILAILGEREGGKSVTAGVLGRALLRATGRRVYYFGVQKVIPPWAERIVSLSEAEKRSIIIMEEGAVSFNNRKSMEGESRDLGSFLAIARHNDLTLFIIAQNASITDVNFWRLADGFIVKPMSINQAATERAGLAGIAELFKEIMPKRPWEHFAMIRGRPPMTWKMGLPTYWKPEYSKAFAAYTKEDVPLAIEIGVRMRLCGMDYGFIANQFRIVQFNMPPAWWASAISAVTGDLDPVQTLEHGEGTQGAMPPSVPGRRPSRKELRAREAAVKAPPRPPRVTS